MTTTWGKENFNFGKYEGHFKDGLRDGDGTFTWKNGDVYNGEWKCGLQDGLGALIEANGVASNGYWEDGVLRQGFEGSTWINIGRYERRFKDGSLAYGHGRSFDGVIRNERDGAAQKERDGAAQKECDGAALNERDDFGQAFAKGFVKGGASTFGSEVMDGLLGLLEAL